MKNKGFTLIELLAAIVVLGILLGLATTNVIGLIKKSRNNSYVEDAKKIVSSAKYKMASDTSIGQPAFKGDCLVMTLSYLGNEDFSTAPNGGKYLNQSSFVVVSKDDSNELHYDVQLVEKYGNGSYRGVKLVDDSKLTIESSSLVVNFTNDSPYNKISYQQSSFPFLTSDKCSKVRLYTDNAND